MPPIYGLYNGCIGQYRVISGEQLLGYPPKGTITSSLLPYPHVGLRRSWIDMSIHKKRWTSKRQKCWCHLHCGCFTSLWIKETPRFLCSKNKWMCRTPCSDSWCHDLFILGGRPYCSGWWFQICFIFIPNPGKWSNLTNASTGLVQPPTR